MAISSIQSQFNQLSSGLRINKAADDAAGLAIAKKLESMSNGYDVGYNNAASGKDMINVANGGLDSMADSLQRMRELSLQASNSAIYSSSDLNAMQEEMDQLKQSIQDAAKGTQFNTMSLLDGSKADYNIASNPDGSGMSIQMKDSTLESLGISDYNITGDFDISAIDKALEKVNSARSSLGAQSNTLDHIMNYNSNASQNLTASQSRIEDLDYPKAISDLKKNQILEQYKMNMTRKQMENNQFVQRLFQ